MAESFGHRGELWSLLILAFGEQDEYLNQRPRLAIGGDFT